MLAHTPKPSLDPFPHPHAINPIAERTKNYVIVNFIEFPNIIRVIYVIGAYAICKTIFVVNTEQAIQFGNKLADLSPLEVVTWT